MTNSQKAGEAISPEQPSFAADLQNSNTATWQPNLYQPIPSVPFSTWENKIMVPLFRYAVPGGMVLDPTPFPFPDKAEVNAQTQTIRPRPKPGRAYLTLHVQPNWVNTRYHAPSVADETVNRSYSDIRKQQEHGAAGITAGMDINMRLTGPLSVSGGLSVNTKTARINYDYIRREIPVIDAASGNIVGYTTINDKDTVQTAHRNVQTYIEMPVMFSWEFGGMGKFSLDIGAGGSLMYLAGVNVRQVNAQTLLVDDYCEPSSFNRWNTSLMGRIGMGYQVTPNWKAMMGVQYQQLLGNTDPSSAAGKSIPSSIGIRLALGYRLF